MLKRIDLTRSFEDVAAAVSSLPLTDGRMSPRTRAAFRQTKMKRLLREIYEAANGRQVATGVGHIAIAPPIAAYLKEAPFRVSTQADFFSQALRRMADRASNDRFTQVTARSARRSTIASRNNKQSLTTKYD